jgi:hypothetical protein
MDWRFLGKREIGADAAIHGWALRDPAAARVAFEETLEDRPRLAGALFPSLVSGWAHSGQGGLEEYLRSAPESAQAEGLGVVIGATLRRRDIDGLQEWSEGFIRGSEPALQATVFRRTVRAVARRDPDRAIAWLAEHVDQDYAAHGHRVLAEEWVQTAPLEAFEWIRTGVPEDRREDAVKLTFGRWLVTRRQDAEAWLDSAPRTAFHDPAIYTLARRLARESPPHAVAWCDRSQGDEWRLDCLSMVAKRWYREDPGAAEAWLEASPLDEPARQGVRDSGRRRRAMRAGVAEGDEGNNQRDPQ